MVAVAMVAGLYAFLVAPRMFGKPDRSQFSGVLYAHRGLFDNKSDSPENSLNAFRKAVENGYGIEFDVQLSKDKIPVVFHDLSLKRVCGIEGNVCDYTLEELQKMRLKRHLRKTVLNQQDANHYTMVLQANVLKLKSL